MPVRNFYISADVDGRATELGGGPRNKEGGMSIHVTQRDDGSIATACKIQCFVNSEGLLVTRVRDKEGKIVFENITERG